MSNKSKDPSVRAIEVLLLRKEPRRGTVVVVRVAHVVRVELDLAVVEVEVRGVVERTVRARIIAPARPRHRKLRFTPVKAYVLSILYFIRQQSFDYLGISAPGKSKQYLFMTARSCKP